MPSSKAQKKNGQKSSSSNKTQRNAKSAVNPVQRKNREAGPMNKFDTSNQSKLTQSNIVEDSQNPFCELCKISDDEPRWFVGCDICHQYFHFECVGITEIGDDEFWQCVNCQMKQRRNSAQPRSQDNQPIVTATAIVHADPEPIIEDFEENPQDNIIGWKVEVGQRKLVDNSLRMQRDNTHRQNVEDPDKIEIDNSFKIVPGKPTTTTMKRPGTLHNGVRSSTLNDQNQRLNKVDVYDNIRSKNTSQSNNGQKSEISSIRSNTSKVRSDTSSHRRRNLEYQRKVEEIELKQKIEEESLTLAQRQLELKQRYSKKLLELKYKYLQDNEDSFTEESSENQMRMSSQSRMAGRSRLTENWIKNQRSQNLQADDVSIPIDNDEWETIKGKRKEFPHTPMEEPVLNPEASEFRYKPRSMPEINKKRVSIDQRDITRNSRPGPSSGRDNQPTNPPLNSYNGTAGSTIIRNRRTIYSSNRQEENSKRHRENENHQSTDEEEVLVPNDHQRDMNRDNQRTNGRNTTLTTNQIAARHAISKELPKFDGNSDEWDRFISRFEKSTKLCGYGHDENLERLDKCLGGNARKIVQSLLNYSESVPDIIETLRRKYGRPELQVKSILAEIKEEPFIRPDKLERLSNFGYKIRNACNRIEHLGLRNYLYGPELIQDVLEKLPNERRIEWARYSQGLNVVSFKAFADWMYRLAETINLITIPDKATNSSDRKADGGSTNSKKGQVNVHGNFNLPETGKRKPCVICSKDCRHPEECLKFKGLSCDERWQSLLANKLCKRCLNKHTGKCKKSKACGVTGCDIKHHTLIHNPQRHSKSNQEKSKESVNASTGTTMINSSNETNVNKGGSHTHGVEDPETSFRYAPVELHHNGRSIKTFAFFDDGTHFTLMEKRTADLLNLKGTPETICMIWTKNVHRQEESELVDLDISGINVSGPKYRLRSVNIVDDLNLSPQSLNPTELARKFKHLKDLPVKGYDNAIPTIMIGVKHARLITPLETIEGLEEDPIATRSRLGWTIHGPMGGNKESGRVNIHRIAECPCKERDEDLHQMVKDHFSIESFGVRANSMSTDSKQNEKALELLKRFTIRKNNRFETRLLWKNDAYILPESYGMAYKRLACLENKGAEVVKVINEFIDDYSKKGYITKLSSEEAETNHPRTFYLPLFTVIHPKKPEKIRPVFDAAAKVQGVSLNSMLLTGPDLLSPIVDVLRRFRENRFAISGDIKEMYHQVTVNEVDRNSQRFLWRNGEKNRKPDVFVMNVMTFGATCSPSAAQYVKNINASEFQIEYPRAAEAIIKNHYVDDMMDGASSINETIKLIQEVKFIHSKAGFEIRGFKSNSKEVLEAIGEISSENRKNLIVNESNVERVLGMFWDTTTDCFMFSLKYTKVTAEMLNGEAIPTKKELLSLLMSIFDPLGLLSYYLIHLKILLQNVWRSKIGWKDRLPDELIDYWKRWIELLPNVERLKIPRWYSTKLSSNSKIRLELHTFVDAGGEAFSAVTYLRIEDKEGVDCILVGSKSRVTPLKYLSTPRKELLGAVLGARLANSVQNGLSLKIDRRVIWTDSSTVLTWLHSDHRKYAQFVAHRVGEILETTNLEEWRWIPSKLNVADEATKWNRKPSFEITDRWFTGPEFLKLAEPEWPKQKLIQPNGTHEEMKLSCSHTQLILPSIINASRFSRWERLVRALARAIRCGKIITSKVKKTQVPSSPLTMLELREAERLLYQQAQWENFTEEMVTLTRNSKVEDNEQRSINKNSSIRDCLPYMDESGMLRVKGRIDSAAAITIDAKRPIIMPRQNVITKLIVDSYHRRFKHQNHETVVNELRQRFYIPQIRRVLKSVRSQCQICKIRRCKPKAPQMADLPSIRFEVGISPFSYTGIDFFGPMEVRIGRSNHKRWAVLFTCLTIRAVHIEIAHSLRTDSCILCIENFMKTYGTPVQFYTDNGKNFKGASKELLKELEQLDTQQLSVKFTNPHTEWVFIPPASPHMGGCWERLIQIVKKCLDVSMPPRTPSDEVLRNILLECKDIVNSRPLTFVPIDAEEAEALTPNHFLRGSTSGLKPSAILCNDGPYLRNCWKESQRCANIFWERFIKEYIPTLTRRAKWFDSIKPIEVGDIVINFDEKAYRNTYNRARVVETVVGSNNQVRRVKIQSSNGSTLWRPAHKIGVLDVSDPAPTAKERLDHPAKTIETGGRNVDAQNLNLTFKSQPKPIATQTTDGAKSVLSEKKEKSKKIEFFA